MPGEVIAGIFRVPIGCRHGGSVRGYGSVHGAVAHRVGRKLQ